MNKVIKLIRLVLLVVMSSLVLLSCQTTSTSSNNNDDIQCGQSSRGEWFDYYWSGLACMDVSNWPKAESELRLALQKMSKDMRREYRTGLHWINHYFPNRELGITLYHLKRYTEAEQSLLTSLAQFPSSKAEYYLNKARINIPAIIAKDTTGPQIAASMPSDDLIVLEVVDDTFVNQVRINNVAQTWQEIVQIEDAQVAIKRAKKKVRLYFRFDPQSTDKIVVEAFDIFNKSSAKTDLTYYLDGTPPYLDTIKSTRGALGFWKVAGQIKDDDSGITTIWLNDQILASSQHSFQQASQQEKVDFSLEIEKPELHIKALDKNGNILSKTIDLATTLPLKLNLAPVNSVTWREHIQVTGQVSSARAIKILSVNNQALQVADNGKFSYQVPVNMGRNSINITVDNGFETISQTHHITRIEANALPQEEKLSIALFPFRCDSKNNVWCNEQEDWQLSDAIKTKQRFNMVEQANLREHIVTVQKCDIGLLKDCAIEALKLIQPNTVLVGEVVSRERQSRNRERISDKETYARMIDPITAKVLIGFDAYYQYPNSIERENKRAMPVISQQLFSKLHEKFPIAVSKKASVQGNQATASFEYQQWLWPKMPIKLFSDDKPCAIGKIDTKTPLIVTAHLASDCVADEVKKLMMVTM